MPREPLPAVEPGRPHLSALLNGPGGPRAKLKTGADDRAETSLRALTRVLWRLGHAQHTAAFATTQDQLIAALLPVRGWTDHGSVLANRQAYGKSVRRWLDRLEAMGVIEWSGVRDNRGQWWRIELRLLTAPDPDRDALQAARRRLRAFGRRERRNRRHRPERRVDLGQVIARSCRPGQRVRRHRAVVRARALHARRGADGSTACGIKKVLPNPFGAPPTSEDHHTPLAPLTPPMRDEVHADRTGAHALETTRTPQPLASEKKRERSEAEGSSAGPRRWVQRDGWLHPAGPESAEETTERLAVIEAMLERGELPPTVGQQVAATRRRAWETLAQWPAGRRIPDRVIGLAFEHAIGQPAQARLARDGRHRLELDQALERYARYAEHRPTGADGRRWPAAPGRGLAHAMAQLADVAEILPSSPVAAIAWLNRVAKQMAAAAKRADQAAELEGRARRRQKATDAPAGPISFRLPKPAWTTRAFHFGGALSEYHRRVAIDAALAGELPGFEGLHGFIVRASDLLGHRNPQPPTWVTMDALRHQARRYLRADECEPVDEHPDDDSSCA